MPDQPPVSEPAALALGEPLQWPSRAAAGDVARDRLLEVGLQLFAEQGFAKTSIRQIAQAAGVNVASVSYYFGNKAGLYRAVYWCGADPGAPPVALPLVGLDDLFAWLLAPLRSGGQARVWVKLQRREMLEPSGVWKEKVDRGMRPLHEALVDMLCARLDLAVADDAVQSLALLVIAPAVHLLLNCEVVDLLAPRLLEDDRAVDAWCGRLVRHAELLIADEAKSRREAAPAGDVGRSSACTPERAAAPPRSPRSPA